MDPAHRVADRHLVGVGRHGREGVGQPPQGRRQGCRQAVDVHLPRRAVAGGERAAGAGADPGGEPHVRDPPRPGRHRHRRDPRAADRGRLVQGVQRHHHRLRRASDHQGRFLLEQARAAVKLAVPRRSSAAVLRQHQFVQPGA